MLPIATQRIVDEQQAHYAGTAGNWVKFYHDAAEDGQGASGAFADIRAAIAEAKRFIFLVDWSFHPQFTLQRTMVVEDPIGSLLLAKAKQYEAMTVAIMPWKHFSIAGYPVATGDVDNNNGGETLKKLNDGQELPPNLLWRAAPYGTTNMWSHHQKFIVLDAPGNDRGLAIKAFFGGLDLTRGRFDWPEHPIYADDNIAFADDWYNGEFDHDRAMPREPWHDIHAQIYGPAAWDFLFEFVARWSVVESKNPRVFDTLYGVVASGMFITPVDARQLVRPSEEWDGPWNSQLLHSINKSYWIMPPDVAKLDDRNQVKQVLQQKFNWGIDAKYERSIQDAYLELIKVADDFIYLESQYLISSGDNWGDTAYKGTRSSVANLVAERLVERIVAMVNLGREFHAYVVLPMFPEGKPDDKATYSVRYLEWCTIEYMVRTVERACRTKRLADQTLGPDGLPKFTWSNYLSFYCLANWRNVFAGADQLPKTVDGRPDWSKAIMYPPDVTTRRDKVSIAQRYMLYVHSKMMLIDDKIALIGSANLNERSLNGDRDSEIAMALWQVDPTVVVPQLQQFRQGVWTEHLGQAWMDETVVQGTRNGDLPPGSINCAQMVQAAARHNFIQFNKGTREDTEKGHLLLMPFSVGQDLKLEFDPAIIGDVPGDYIPDYPQEYKDLWEWVAGPTFYSNKWISWIGNIGKVVE